MFYYLNGTVAEIEPYLAVIDCAGIGFACSTSMNTLSMLEVGSTVRMYTYCNVREDAFDIYGFATRTELNCFKLLIGITGVGPKAALSILSANSPEALAASVIGGNEKALTAAPGVGKKLAQRIILELKDKMGKELEAAGGFIPQEFAAASQVPDGKAEEITAALTVLGYNPAEISGAMKRVDISGLTVEQAIREILRMSLK